MSKLTQYKLGEPFGESSTKIAFGKHRIYGGGGGGDSVTSTEIPEELKPLANRYVSEANKLFDTPYQGFEGQRYAGLDPYQSQGLEAIAQRATGGDALMNAGYGNVMDTLSGKYMSPDSNPYLRQNVQNAMDQVGGTINSQFNKPGAFGGSAHEGVMSRELGGIASNMYGQNYANERNNQLQAWGAAPTFGNAVYQDATQLMNAGQMKQDEAQKGLDWNLEKFQEQQDYPYKNLSAASGVFGSNLGGSSTSSGGGK